MAATKRKVRSLKNRIEDYVLSIDQAVPNPERKKTGVGANLYEVFVWQTIHKLAEGLHKKAYKKAQPAPIPADDTMRSMGKGDWIITESSFFSLTAKVTEPRKTFNLDLFLAQLHENYDIPVPELSELAANCKSEGNPVLTKRVLEA